MRVGKLANATAATSLLLIAGATHALPTVTYSVSAAGTQADQSAPTAAQTAFLETLASGHVTEGFESFAGGERNLQFNTVAGTFTQAIAGYSGLCETLPDGCSGGLAVLDADTTVYGDRYPVGEAKWLDNVGSRHMLFAPIAAINSIGFFAVDMRDHLYPVTVTVVSAGELIYLGNIFGDTPDSNAQVRYVTFTSSDDIEELLISTNTTAEGFGIDNVTVGSVATGAPAAADVPEPSALGLLGIGLAGATALRRLRASRH